MVEQAVVEAEAMELEDLQATVELAEVEELLISFIRLLVRL